MSFVKCANQDELREHLRQGHWPEASSAEMREHVAGCRRCEDLVRLTVGFRRAREASLVSAKMMPPGLIWWRARLRRRQQAIEHASRPIWTAEIFALLVSLAGMAGGVFWMVENGYARAWQAWVADLGTSLKTYAGALGNTALVAGVATLVFLGLLTVWATADSE